MFTFIGSLGVAVAVAISAGAARDGGLVEKLMLDTPVETAVFGYAVAVHGDFAMVGAMNDNPAGSSSGSVTVFRRDPARGWIETQKFTASDTVADDQFGCAVAMNADVAIVGAWGQDDPAQNGGAAYVFRYDTKQSMWIQEQKLHCSHVEPSAWFGYDVEISGRVAAVWARHRVGSAPARGAGHVFEFDGSDWKESAMLSPSGEQVGESYAGALALDGDVLVLGAPEHVHDGIGSGVAFVYRHGVGGWSLKEALVAADAAPDDGFGGSVAVAGDVILVGAFHDDIGGQAEGSAHVFRRRGDRWLVEQRLSGDRPGARFGCACAVSGRLALIGARADDSKGTGTGAAYVYACDGQTWSRSEKLVALDPRTGQYFGRAVALDGRRALVGTEEIWDLVKQGGAAYAFDLKAPPELKNDGRDGSAPAAPAGAPAAPASTPPRDAPPEPRPSGAGHAAGGASDNARAVDEAGAPPASGGDQGSMGDAEEPHRDAPPYWSIRRVAIGAAGLILAALGVILLMRKPAGAATHVRYRT